MNHSPKIGTIFLFAVLSLVILSLGSQSVFSQPPGGTPIISPEVLPDRTVTFRLLAPNAENVQVGGEFATRPLSMTKDEKGIWSVTTPPLEPNTYGYNFIMDGLTMPDPSNTHVRVGALWFATQVDVPGDKPAFFAAQDVPHGTMHGHWYYSKALKTVRHVNVYTPPGYNPSADKPYPVLYLLHGMGDDEGFWTQVGYANFIMDNLLATGKAKPALIAMPFGHSSRAVRREPRAGGPPAGTESRGGPLFGVEVLENDLIENVIPLVEKEYRAGNDANHRAIAGLSMGGYQALSIGLANPDKFAYVGAFSSALLNQDLEDEFKSLLDNPEKANKHIRLLWIGCGADDRLLSGNQKFHDLLTAKGIRHEWVTTPGYGHVWTLWRVYLRDLLPKLFN
jgi:enterochelin esterase-like enzyme